MVVQGAAPGIAPSYPNGRQARAHTIPAVTNLRITHVGGPTALIEVGGWRLLTDPTFDPPGRRYVFGWGTSSRKLAGPAISASDLAPIDAVLLSHDHHDDNLDDAGRAMLPSAGVVVTTTSGAERLGGDTRGLAPWATTRLEAPWTGRVDRDHGHAVPARPAAQPPDVGRRDRLGLRWEGQEHGALWISGDTVLYGGVRQVADRLDVGTAIVHLGGVRFPVSGPLRYTMTAREAVELCGLIRPRKVIPIHYEGWKHFRECRGAIEREFASAPEGFRDSVTWLPIGVPIELPLRDREAQPGARGVNATCSSSPGWTTSAVPASTSCQTPGRSGAAPTRSRASSPSSRKRIGGIEPRTTLASADTKSELTTGPLA